MQGRRVSATVQGGVCGVAGPGVSRDSAGGGGGRGVQGTVQGHWYEVQGRRLPAAVQGSGCEVRGRGVGWSEKGVKPQG